MTKDKYSLAVFLVLAAAIGFYLATVYQTGTFLKVANAVQRWSLWGSFATCASALFAACAVWVAVWSFHSQVQQSKITLGVEVLMKLNDDFDSQRMRTKRALAAKSLKDHPGEGTADIDAVLDFIEGVALFERRGVIETEFVWHDFYEWFSPYYHLTKTYRAEVRNRDSTIWVDLEGLYQRVSPFQGADQPRHPTPAELTEFLNDEIMLVD
ncbi:DUF4760 domain-containing protein [Paraburkholderia aspalathi]|uniref:Phage abortive infection protein n=1 Tax=Paraburkholderia aspalathi TaxID=1324617 RepID=A0A1I6Y5C7_9BURK|nr:hypothetical protein [Paraburkholderia aspalathi]SFT45607.1 hypothetical protein SAMN05192563_1001322 [Paraburkholderia aspalathi]